MSRPIPYLDEELEECLDASQLFEDVSSLRGEVFREVAQRRTIRFEWRGRGYFAKTHFGVGWKEILKNLSQLRLPILGAENEWRAIHRLTSLGIETMTAVAYTNDGLNPAATRSCIVTRELVNTISLEDLCKHDLTPGLKHKLVKKLAVIAGKLHDHGINHRDFYICHFLLDTTTIEQDNPVVYLIDLHRAQIRRQTPRRWRVKDIGGLFYSIYDLGFNRRDLYRFMKIYSGKGLRQTLSEDRSFWRSVRSRADNLYRQDKADLPLWIKQLPDAAA